MTLAEFWFFLIAFFFVGYFVLEGFDFGVGTLLPVLGRDDTGRRVLINTIGPFWDANETWVIVAGASLFAAFPYWYASLFSGFYLPLLLLLVALIVRGVAFEYRGKVDDDRWRRRWDAGIVFGSAVPAVLWGVAFANIVRGVPIDARGNLTGSVFSLLHPYALLGGVVLLALSVTHGAIFIALKTVGEVRYRARRAAGYAGAATVVLGGGFLVWTNLAYGTTGSVVLSVVAVLALLAALIANRGAREGWAFGWTALTIAATVAALFAALYPDVLPSTTNPAYSLTIENASSTPRTLTAMSWVALAVTPFVLAYQAWTYWVFRRRIGRDNIPTRLPHGAGNVLGR
jgi:cytochrome bd ubiquinol oxidase subunit II